MEVFSEHFPWVTNIQYSTVQFEYSCQVGYRVRKLSAHRYSWCLPIMSFPEDGNRMSLKHWASAPNWHGWLPKKNLSLYLSWKLQVLNQKESFWKERGINKELQMGLSSQDLGRWIQSVDYRLLSLETDWCKPELEFISVAKVRAYISFLDRQEAGVPD
jgi:hypothetical protein